MLYYSTEKIAFKIYKNENKTLWKKHILKMKVRDDVENLYHVWPREVGKVDCLWHSVNDRL
jgi:hypothetical protein